MSVTPNPAMPTPPADIASMQSLPPGEYMERSRAWLEWGEKAKAFGSEMMQKALDAGMIDIDGDVAGMVKAIGRGEKPTRQPYKIVQALMANGMYQGVTERSSTVGATFDGLRRMGNNPIIRTITESRMLDFAAFSHTPRFQGDTGWRPILRDPDARPTIAEREEMQEIARLVNLAGIRRQRMSDKAWGVWDPDEVTTALPFTQLNRTMVRDSLIMDAAALRIHRGVHVPVAFMAADDAARVRKLVPDYAADVYDAGTKAGITYVPELRQDVAHPSYAMLAPDGQRLREYSEDEMGYWVRNPRTDLWTNGYGFSELESLVQVVMGLELGMRFNISFFTENHVPPGLILLKGGVVRDDIIDDFLATVVGQTGGVGKWWKTPIWWTNEPHGDANFIRFRDNEHMDMMWREWTILLINLACALYHVAAEQIGFQAFLTRGGQQSGVGGAERVSQQNDVGLRTLLYDSENFWDYNVVSRFGTLDSTGMGPYRFAYEGVSDLNEMERLGVDAQKIGAGVRTLNEIRGEHDQSPYFDPLDRDLWEECVKVVDEINPDLKLVEKDHDEAVAAVYQQSGGKLARWPNMPLYQGAIQLIQMEHQEVAGQPGYGPDPNEMGGDEEQGPPGGGTEMEPAWGGGDDEENADDEQGAPPEAALALAKAVKSGDAAGAKARAESLLAAARDHRSRTISILIEKE